MLRLAFRTHGLEPSWGSEVWFSWEAAQSAQRRTGSLGICTDRCAPSVISMGNPFSDCGYCQYSFISKYLGRYNASALGIRL